MQTGVFWLLAPAPPAQHLRDGDDKRGEDEGADDPLGNPRCVDRGQLHARPSPFRPVTSSTRTQDRRYPK